ncbi:GNAT family N-acetyltransferase [Henriciella barbarensis]|uniref:GNAT family N-acetyltransferase n=1 Tax=Henriciella barbarensis TaxID=86342 RepID=A0A399QNZ1_9PROT|nr:GNAT family N-acetyltransferase [Henriciella barbarensis]RIJ20578.1 GNAT family N-acetyltransferase [Henriciella barbarensis]
MAADLTGVTIRAAVPGDAAALEELGQRTFLEKFGHLYAKADLDTYLEEAHAQTFYAHMIDSPDYLVRLAALPDGALGAYLVCSPLELPADDAKEGAVELMRLYVDTPLQGRGLGSHFIGEAVDWAKISRAPELYLSVFSENEDARRLYERHGFEKVGEFDFPVGNHLDLEFLMRLKLE